MKKHSDIDKNQYWWQLTMQTDQEFVSHQMVSDALEFVFNQLAATNRNRYFKWSRRIDAKHERDFMLKQIAKVEMLSELIATLKFQGVVLPSFTDKPINELLEEIKDDFYSPTKTFRI